MSHHHHRRQQRQLERIEARAVIPPSLEQAFMEIEKPMVRYTDAPARTEACANGAR